MTGAVVLAQYRSTNASLTLVSRLCSQNAKFEIGGSKDKDGIIRQGEGFSFQGLSWLALNACKPGLLTFTADGEVVFGSPPQLDVALNGVVIDSEKFSGRRTVRVRIPQSGLVTITFVNDYYKADVRIAIFSRPMMSSGACRSIIGVNTPFESAGTWDAIHQVGTVVRRDPPITIVPCTEGKFTFYLKGQAGAGEYPKISISQAGSTIQTCQTGPEFKRLAIKVKNEPIEFSVVNPYAKLIADRNVNVSRISFQAR